MDHMTHKLGIFGLISGALGMSLAYIVDLALRVNDGINGLISPFLALILSYFPIAESPKGFTDTKSFQLTEEGAIWFLGSIAVFLGLVGILSSLVSIKKREDARASFAALATGSGPIIMLSLPAGLCLFLVAGLTAIFYQQHLTNRATRTH